MKIFYKVCILSILLIFYITNLSSAPKDTVYIKGDAHFPPYEYLNEEGEPEGYNIDLIQAIMQELDTPYIIKLGLWSDAIRDMENKNIDVLTSMIFTKERSLKFRFGISHLTLKYVIVYNNKKQINNILDLSGAKLVIQEGEFATHFIDFLKEKPTIKYVNSTYDGLMYIQDGKADAIICDKAHVQNIIKSNKLKGFTLIDLDLMPAEYCIVGGNDSLLSEINQAYYKLRYNGTVKTIKEKWFNSEPSLNELYLYLYISFSLIVLLGTSIYFLRRKVRLTKSDLSLNLRRYFTLFQNAPIGLEYYDKEGYLTDINNVGLNIFGVTDKVKILRGRLNIYENPIFRSIVSKDKPIEQYIGTVEINPSDYKDSPFCKFANKNESLFLQIRIFPISDTKNKLQSIICSYTDITKSIHINRKERNTRENLYLALEAGKISAWLYEVKTGIINNINRKDQSNSYTLEQVKSVAHPEDKEKITQIFNSLLSKELNKAEVILRFKNKEVFDYYEFKFVSKIIKGKVISIAATQKNITSTLNNQKTLEEYISKIRYAIKTTESVFFEFNTQTKEFRSYNEPLNNYNDNILINYQEYIDITHPEDKETLKNYINSMIAGETLDKIDIRQRISEDAEWDYISITTAPFRKNAKGEIIKYVGFRRILTSHVKNQKMLEEYKTKMNLAIDNSEITIWDYDTILDQFTISSNEDLFYNSINDYFKLFGKNNPDIENAYNIMTNKLNESFKIDIKFINRANSHWEYYTIGGIPFSFDNNGKCTKYTGYRINTTQWNVLNKKLKDSSHILNTIIEKLPCALYIKDINNDFRYITANKLCSKYMMKSNEEIIGKTDTEISGNKIGEEYRRTDSIAIKEGIYTYQDEDIVNKRVYQTTKSIISTYSGHKLLIGVKLDITSLNNTLQELKEEKEKALQADKLKSAFLANMSHEIRTPLNSIVGFSELLQHTDNEEDKQLFINIIKQNNEILLRLIGDILDLSKIESGYIDLKPEVFDLSPVVEDSVISQKQRVDNPKLTINLINPYKSCIVNLDKNRVIQILNNFISNAIKYTREGEITISYIYENQGISIRVKDTGIGIPSSKIGKVFGRFEKLDDFAQGTGLGLAICKAIVERKKGKIGVESNEGEGSLFWVWIPCSAEIL